MDLPNVNKGLIILNIESFYKNKNIRTQNWETENNQRKLKEEELCKYFKFHYAINGNITTLRRKEYLERSSDGLFVVLDDDKDFGEFENVEVGIRLSGCKRGNTFKLTHVYWA